MVDTKHLLSWRETSSEFWRHCLEETVKYAAGAPVPRLDRHFGLVFMNPSLRTRASMEVAAARLASRVTVLAGQDAWKLAWDDGVTMDGDEAEHVREAARVLSGYFDAIGVRSFAPLANASDPLTDTPVARFAGHSSRPVINLESAAFHPCQALADAAVLSQDFGSDLTGVKFVLAWSYHPRALPVAVPQSTLLMAARMGADVTVAVPPELAMSERLMAEAGVLARQHGGSVRAVADLDEAMTEAHVVYAKSWTPAAVASSPDGGERIRSRCRDWRITASRMATTESGRFMHCLPVRRNVVVDDDVLESSASLVQRQARMRVDANVAILAGLAGRSG